MSEPLKATVAVDPEDFYAERAHLRLVKAEAIKKAKETLSDARLTTESRRSGAPNASRPPPSRPPASSR